jgi:hypothetical protein
MIFSFMIDDITLFLESKCKTTTRPPGVRLAPTASRHSQPEKREQRTGFTKMFRWPVPVGQTPPPTAVEVVGSFSGWHRVPLSYDPPSKTWQLILNDVESNRTHRYVILVDGNPSYDKTCDGLAAPQTPDEAKWQIATPKGPRIMLLFSQTK